MKREFLTSLKLEDEVINKIIDEYGKSVNSTKQQLNERTEELKATNSKITAYEKQMEETKKLLEQSESFKAENESFKKQLEDLQTTFTTELDSKNKEISNVKKSSLVKDMLVANGAKHTDLLMKITDFDAVEVKDDSLKGFDKQLETFKANYKDLFVMEPIPNAQPEGGNDGNTGGTDNKWASYVDSMFNK